MKHLVLLLFLLMPLLVHAGYNIVKGDSCLAVYDVAQALRLLQPDSTAMFLCHRGLAESFYGMKNYTASLPYFEEAVRYNSASLTSYYYAAVCAEATGDKDGARRWLSTFIKLWIYRLGPDDSVILFYRTFSEN